SKICTNYAVKQAATKILGTDRLTYNCLLCKK
ncbi:MAG: hypothetical protein ACI87N_001698, partial [Flavobacteriales bacterium]